MILIRKMTGGLTVLVTVFITVSLVAISDGRAALIVTQDETIFNAATAGRSFTLESFDSVPDGNLGTSASFGVVTVTSGFDILTGINPAACLIPNCLVVRGDLTLSFSSPVSAVGFFIGDGDGNLSDVFVDGQDTGVDASFPGNIGEFSFLGVFDDMGGSFTSITLPGGIASSGSFELENVSFTIEPITVSVPEPGTLALVSLGLLGLGSLRRRQRAR